MALNFNPEAVDGTSIARNQRAVERHLDDDHYVRRFYPGGGLHPISTATIVPDGSSRWPLASFPDAAATEAYAAWEKPSEWRTGKLEINVWYTAALGSTNNFRIAVTVNAARVGEALPATTLYAAFATIPGPAVAYTLLQYGPVYTTTAFGSDDETFSLKVRREGGDAVNDTNTNAFLVQRVRVRHIPAEAVSQ